MTETLLPVQTEIKGCLYYRLATVLPLYLQGACLQTCSNYLHDDRQGTSACQDELFAATTKGVELLHRRLLEGPVDFFDTCMHELTLAGKVQRSEFPLAGSRAHYSLVNGGQMLAEEIPGRND